MKKVLSLLIAGVFLMLTLVTALPASAADNVFVNGINSARANQGKTQLAVNGDLQRTAQDKANRMAKANALVADGYSDAWKGGSQAVAADPAARASELLKNDFIGRQGSTTLNGSYGIIGVGEAVSSNGTLYVAINVAPAPYVPGNGGAGSGSNGGDSQGNNGGSSADNSAAIAEAEARVRAEAVEAQKQAEIKAKVQADAEAKKQAEAKRIADAEAKKVAEAEAKKQAEAVKVKEEADAKAKEEAETKQAETEAKIAEAQEQAKIAAEAKKQAEAEAQKQAESQAKSMNTIFVILRVLLALSVLSVLASAGVLLRSRPVPVKEANEVLGIEAHVPEFIEDDEEWIIRPGKKTSEEQPTAPTTNTLPTLPKRENRGER